MRRRVEHDAAASDSGGVCGEDGDTQMRGVEARKPGPRDAGFAQAAKVPAVESPR